MRSYFFKLGLLCLLSITLWNCHASKSEDFDKVLYRYSDSSIPPEHYRSYTIIWQANGEGFLSIDVYGDTIVKENFEIKAEDFKKLQELRKNIQREGTKTSDASGTSHQLIQLFFQDEKVYERYWDNLNAENEATKIFIDFIKEHTPDLEKLLSTPYNVETTTKEDEFAKDEYEQLLALKEELKEVSTSEEEKEALNKIWLLTRKHIELEEGKQPPYIFNLRVKSKAKEDMLDFYVYAEYSNHPSGASWEERVEWKVDFSHQLIDSDNYQVLLGE